MTRPKTKILVDGGDPQETRRAKELLGFVDGQTTNPSLIAKNPHIKELIASGHKLSGRGEMDGLVNKNDWPRFVEEEPEVYEQTELDKLLAACDEEERLWFEFFLMTGMREQEVTHCYWLDINFAASTVRVSHKPDLGWTPKAYKEREIPIPEKLVQALKAHKANQTKAAIWSSLLPAAGRSSISWIV